MHIRLFSVLVAFILLAGCGTREGEAEDRRAFTSVDPWFNPPPSNITFTTVEPDRMAPVVADLQSEAQDSLRDVAARRLTADDAARLTGKRLPPDGEYVLLRAVVLNEATGGFDVRVQGTVVYVLYGCIGGRPLPMRRKAIVAVLPAVPTEVYTSCGMAE